MTISPASASLQTGATQQFTASVTGTSNTAVTWSAIGGTIATTGLYTAPAAPGSYTVTATSAADNSKFASVTVNVSSAPQSVSVSILPSSLSLQTGTTQQFTAIVTGTTNTAVTWSATAGTITAGGLYTAPATVGSYTVTATSVADNTKTASSTVTVSTSPAPIAVSISPVSASLLTGATRQFAAVVTGTSNTALTWSATGGSITTAGLYTAPAVAGTYIVKATSVADTSKSASATITVTAPVAVTISPTSATVQTSGTKQFVATVTGTTNTAVTWSATGGSITTGGLYTAPAAAGIYTVTATSVADSSKFASATVVVTLPVAVAISPTSATLAPSGTQQFTATVTGGSGNTSVAWSATAGSITTAGLYTAPTTAGSYTVKATSVADGTKSASATVVISTNTPPTVALVAASASANSAAISWTTDKDSNSQVEYGTTTSYGLSVSGSAYVSAHFLSVFGLSASTTYHYRVRSTDAGGHGTVSGDYTFTTSASSAGIPSSLGWYQVPNTMLQSVCPPNTSQYAFSDNCYGVIAQWSGATLDLGRNRMIIWGGGHNTYYGNELYAFNLNALTLTRLNNPSPIASTTNTTCGPNTLSDGLPNARQTYDGLVYIQHADRMFAYGGVPASPVGCSIDNTWTLNLATLQWQSMDPHNGATPQAMPGVVADYDPNTKLVFLHDQQAFFSYNYDTNTYTELNSWAPAYPTTGVIDPVRKLFIMIGGDGVKVISIAPGSTYQQQDWTAQATGCGPLEQAYVGLAYDRVQNVVVGWNGGNTVYVFNPDTKACTPVTYPNGPGSPPGAGTFGRWRYIAALGVFAIVNNAAQNAYTLRLTPPGGSSAPSITNVAASGISSSGATITWNTDVAATSQVAYGPTSAYGQLTTLDSTVVTSHLQTLTSLLPGTTYHYQVRSSDSNGVGSASPDMTFTTLGVADTTAPTVLVTAPASGATVSGTVTVTATASDNVGVAGVQLQIDGITVGNPDTATPYTFSWNTVGYSNGSHTAGVLAWDAAGNRSSASVPVTVSNAGNTANNWASRCAGANVIRCWDFDDQATTDPHIFPPWGKTTKSAWVVNDVVSDGAGAIRFTIPSQSSADSGGSFWLDFMDDYSVQFGQGQEFYLQYRVRYNDVMVNTYFTGGAGFKTSILGEGDRPGYAAMSCTQLELPIQNIDQFGEPRMYHSCGGKDGNYEGLQIGIPGGSYDFLDQNAAGCTHYGDRGWPKTEPPCFKYKVDQWMTFQYHVKVGTWYLNDGNYHRDSTVEMWAANDGEPSRLITSVADYDLANSDDPLNAKYGKIWLLPYNTGKDPTQVTGTGYVWYDDLVVSRSRIPDPGATTPQPPDTLRAIAVSSSQINLTWRDNADNELGYKVERCQGEGAVCWANTLTGWQQVATLGANTASWSDTGLTSGTKYNYRVYAYNASGNSAYSGGACWDESHLPCYATDKTR